MKILFVMVAQQHRAHALLSNSVSVAHTLSQLHCFTLGSLIAALHPLSTH